MLAHSSTLPLVIDYFIRHDDLSEADEEGSILALKKHNFVRRVCLQITVTSLQRIIAAMDGHNLLSLVSNVKNLRIDRGLVEEFSRSLSSDSHLDCYPNYRKSHVSELAVPLVRLGRSSMFARIQVSLYTSFTIHTCTGGPSTDRPKIFCVIGVSIAAHLHGPG